MSTSRRKQPHPKSLKGKKQHTIEPFIILFYNSEDALLFMLPDELKCDEEVSL